ncbi:MAG TPA: hypothetical protein VMB74_07255 [Streptosporangiaceae bacterium]|nr:hypothetical protein [Streptosporangiaceae bacterium]
MAATAAASPAYAATTTASFHAAVPVNAGPVKTAQLLADPALHGAGPLAAPAIHGPAPLATAAIGGTGSGGSPLAAPAGGSASPHPQAATASPAQPQPTASPTPSSPGSPGQQSTTDSQSGSSQQSAPQRPYEFYDSVTPSAIPPGKIVATYASGPFAVSQAQVAGRPQVLWIDTNGSDPKADVLDVEPGDATPSMAASWAYAKLHAEPNSLACIYTMLSEWPATQAAIATLPASMQSHIRWWIADPNGIPHIVPGANATQWYWGSSYDISSANSGL